MAGSLASYPEAYRTCLCLPQFHCLSSWASRISPISVLMSFRVSSILSNCRATVQRTKDTQTTPATTITSKLLMSRHYNLFGTEREEWKNGDNDPNFKVTVDTADSFLKVGEQMRQLRISILALQATVATLVNPANPESAFQQLLDQHKIAQNLMPATEFDLARQMLEAVKAGQDFGSGVVFVNPPLSAICAPTSSI
jgi:hypothetical protein